jgi:hypothetical protein
LDRVLLLQLLNHHGRTPLEAEIQLLSAPLLYVCLRLLSRRRTPLDGASLQKF